METKNVVIVGAGYAGVLTAKKLAKKLRKHKDVTVTIIDKNPFHTMYTELHEVAAHRVDEDSIKISLERVFAGRRVVVAMDTIQNIDFDKKTVKGAEKEYPYDYLVLATGSKPTFFGVPGAEEISYTLWSYDDAVVLREHIMHVFRRAARETDLEEKKRLLTFYVVGAGFTGVEMVGELAELVPFLCDKFEIDRSLVSIFDVDVLGRTVPILPEKLSGKVEKRLKKMGVQVLLNTGVAGIGKNYIELKQGETIQRHSAGTVIWTAGIESSDIVSEAAKALQTARRGRIKVDKYLRALDHEEVYVAGDNIMYIPEGEKDPVPQMVENCEQSADTIAHNLAQTITGQGQPEEYHPKFHGIMVSVGGRYGVARVGMPNFMFNLPSFLAMFTKHFINVVYFVQVLGWNKVFSYIRHEFFTIRNCRSFLGGHFSNRTPSFLLVPLRVWLGLCWVFEGVMKIVEGWMKTPMLTDFFGGANSFFNNILISAGARNVNAAVDAVASATAAADGSAAAPGVAVFSYRLLGWIDATLVSATDLAHSVIGDYAFKLDIPLMNWFVNAVILPSDGVQLFMQIFIVVAEIAIGLALIGGLFTTPASGFSLVLQFMFVCTTGLYLNTFWMIFAAVAVLIGGGRTLGLDYYAMPALKKWWKNLPFIRKWYLYND